MHLAQVPAGGRSPVPRRHRLFISPQPALLGLGLRFHVGVLLATIWWKLFGVAPEVPSHSDPDLLQASVGAVDQHVADLAPVSVGLAALGHGFTVTRAKSSCRSMRMKAVLASACIVSSADSRNSFDDSFTVSAVLVSLKSAGGSEGPRGCPASSRCVPLCGTWGRPTQPLCPVPRPLRQRPSCT